MCDLEEKPTFLGFKWSHFDSLSDPAHRNRATAFLSAVDWITLKRLASEIRGGIGCELTADVGLGQNHMVRILQFEDNTRLVARLQLPPLTYRDLDTDALEVSIRSEISTMNFVARRADLAVPRTYVFETRVDCDVGAPFILMDCLDGNVGVDLNEEIPLRYKKDFIRALARIYVRLSQIRLPKIGKILSIAENGTCEQGPIPGIGGPFDTAAEFYTAWSKNITFGAGEDRLRELTGEYAEVIIASIASFRESIARMADSIAMHNSGPFPLIHGDLGHHNVLVDDDYNVKGVIDFESAFAGPWEIAAGFPLNLMIMPPSIDAPWNYDSEGNAVQLDLAQKLEDQNSYVKAVEMEESYQNEPDSLTLTRVMLDSGRQQLGTAMSMFREGKPGWYGNLIEMYSPGWSSGS